MNVSKTNQEPIPKILKLVNEARNSLPENLTTRPWILPSLNYGKFQIADELSLKCYLAAFGEMHHKRLSQAFSNFALSKVNREYELYDWECGQGLATLEFIDFINGSNSNIQLLKKINLISHSSRYLEVA